MNRIRRAVAGSAVGALVVSGLAALSLGAAPAAQAEEITIDDAQLRWGINNETNNAAFAPGTWNLLSAGKVGDPGAGSQTLTTADEGATWSNDEPAGWTNQAGNVTIEDLQADGSYAPTTFDGTREDSTGTRVTAGNSIYAETQVVFRNGTGTVDAAANTASIAWEGDASIIYYSGYTFFYLSDPELTVEADGTGAITATLDGFGSDQSDQSLWVDLDEQEVTLATLVDVDVEDLGLTTTPDYLGVEYESDDAAQVRTGDTWGSFPQSFVDFVTLTGGGPYWYSTGGAADSKKVPLPLEVLFEEPDTGPAPAQVTVSDTRLLPHGKQEVTVTGSGFDPTLAEGTRPPLLEQPAGAYVVFGKFAEDWRPSTGADGDTRVSDAQQWATPGGVAPGTATLEEDGTFSVTLEIDKAALDAKVTDDSLVNYGIYTYAGSGAAEASYETYTPLTFAKARSNVRARVTKKVTTKQRAKVKAVVRAPGIGPAPGKVKIRVVKIRKGKKNKAVKALNRRLQNGTRTVRLPRLAKGRYRVVVRYAARPNITAGKNANAFRVVKPRR